jgi:hypothetical protein
MIVASNTNSRHLNTIDLGISMDHTACQLSGTMPCYSAAYPFAMISNLDRYASYAAVVKRLAAIEFGCEVAHKSRPWP